MLVITFIASSISNREWLSVDLVNSLIAFISLVVAIIAMVYAKRADNKSNEIANKQRIDGLMPDVIITGIEAKTSLFSIRFPLMHINSVSTRTNDLDYFILNDTSKIYKNQLVRRTKIIFYIKNSSSNSATILLKVTGEEEKNVVLSGSDELMIPLINENIVATLSEAKKIIDGKQEASYELKYKGLGTNSYDEIKGNFIIPYLKDFTQYECIKISEYNSQKKRVY